MAPPPPPQTDLIDGVTAEILLLLPPDEPEHLFRAALANSSTATPPPASPPPRRCLTSPTRAPTAAARARSTAATAAPSSTCSRTMVYWYGSPRLGPRHGRPAPPAGHCRGGPFLVVFVATDDDDLFIKASVDSSETGAWSVPVSLDNGAEYYAQHRQDAIAHEHYCIPYVQPRRVALIGDDIYLTLRRDNAIIKYDRAHHCLSMINPLSPNDGSLGFACVQGSNLCLWSRNVNSKGAEWVVGFAEGLGVIFISTHVGLFTIELKSWQVRKVDRPGVYYSVLPYMSFYT
uniref:Uncharacterized protein n=1 Tax=Setaria italica TaxID=4555 RepID=K4A2I9_SETIT